MSKKKKQIIIIAVLLICIAVTVTVMLLSQNSGEKQQNQAAGDGDISAEETAGADNSEQDSSENEAFISESTEADHEHVGAATEEAKKPTTESGSTTDGNKPTGGTSGSTTSQPITTQTPTTQIPITQAPTTQAPTTTSPTTQTPSTTEQPSGGNQGGGNGDNTHQHTWEAQYRTVHHDEEGHFEDVCVKKAYDEPVYEYHYFCNYCELDLGTEQLSHCLTCGPPMPEDDPFWEPGATEGSSYSTGRVQVGTTHHEAVYEKKWIVDKKAYDEQVQDGYKCTTCGATKGK